MTLKQAADLTVYMRGFCHGPLGGQSSNDKEKKHYKIKKY